MNGTTATISVDGALREVDVSLVEEPRLGDYVLVHAGFAITVIDAEEARKSLQIFAEYSRLVGEE